METNKYSTIMSEKDDVELIRIARLEYADYQPEAVIAAEEELKKRNITLSMQEEFAKKVEKLIETEKEREAGKQNLPLSMWIKVIAFVFPLPLFFIIGLVLMLFGYQIRGKGLCKWTFFGWVLYFIIIMFIEISFK